VVSMYANTLSIDEPELSSYTPADSTNSKETVKLAQYWIEQCSSEQHPMCPNKYFRDPPKMPPHFSGHKRSNVALHRGEFLPRGPRRQAYYPSRVIDLRSHQIMDPISGNLLDKTKVRLIETRCHQLQGDQEGYYVTLSHRWGNNRFTQLRNANLSEFKESMLVSSLPQTFQDVIHFARLLSTDIRYIWIDSLCILQDDKVDWEVESVQMHKVYRNSYCNFSATAATDSDPGLYFKRDRYQLLENEINLNVEGLRVARDNRSQSLCKMRTENEKKIAKIDQTPIRRCIVRDASLWSRIVEDAPVNERAWVLQERLLAPRVLHFCRGQIAWECSELEAAESAPYGVWGLEFDRQQRLRQKHRLRTHVPEKNTDWTGLPDAHELWKRVVERYSTTQLTKHKDRLYALAGIAQTLKKRIGGQYVAGMWEIHLASQLLWQVPPVVHKDRSIHYPSKRPDYEPGDVHAPSFSWAAVYTPGGIKCSETYSGSDVRIDIVKFHGIPNKNDERFGLVNDDCYLDLLCAMHRIEFREETTSMKNTHYAWRLLDGKEGNFIQCMLDSPRDDFGSLQGPLAIIYCVPVFKNSSEELKCLLLKEEKVAGELYYRRVGFSSVERFYWQHGDTLKTLWPEKDSTLPRNQIRIR
jgi:hypothetical protein